MKWMIASLISLMLFATSQANASGFITYEHVGCSGGFKTYAINWGGAWDEELIFMEHKKTWETVFNWEFFIGYLDDTGKYYPTARKDQFRMMAQPDDDDAYINSNVATIPTAACGPPV